MDDRDKIINGLDEFNEIGEELNNDSTIKLKTDKSIVERINKTIIVEDGRSLLRD